MTPEELSLEAVLRGTLFSMSTGGADIPIELALGREFLPQDSRSNQSDEDVPRILQPHFRGEVLLFAPHLGRNLVAENSDYQGGNRLLYATGNHRRSDPEALLAILTRAMEIVEEGDGDLDLERFPKRSRTNHGG
jgi:hypothetical protein